MAALRIGVFSPSVLLDVARSAGRLAEAGFGDVEEIAVRSSPAAFAALRDGQLDALLTSPDNVLAYRFLKSNPLGALLDVVIAAGVDRGLGLCLGLRPGVDDVRHLRGGRLGVDVASSGFAFVAYALLSEAGLSRNDVEIVQVGSTPKRAQALIGAACDVTVLSAGSELLAREHGCVLTGDVTTVGPYLGTVVACLEHSSAAADLDRVVDVVIRTAGEVSAGSHRDLVVAAAQRLLGLDSGSASDHAALLRDPHRGLVGDGMVDAAALGTLIELRRRFMPAPELDELPHRLGEVVRADRFAGNLSV